ncbi:MAG: biopolymer transporter ExbD [Myxococcota bacterium]
MGGKLGTDSGFDDINMTPLIDIVLVVLIIMMVNIPIEVQELGVKVPNPNSPKPPPPPPGSPPQLMVAVYDDGKVALNRLLMTETKLKAEIAQRLRSLSKKNVFVDAHPDVPFASVVDMLDMAREAGAEKVGFAKLKETGPLDPVGSLGGALPRGIIVGNPTVVERLDTKTLDNVIVDAQLKLILPNIEQCYLQALGANATLTGDYLIEVTVGPDGLQMADHAPKFLKDSLKDETVRQCTEQLLPKLQFPAIGQQNTAVVRYPLLFSPG